MLVGVAVADELPIGKSDFVFVDQRGLIYTIDRIRGMHIVERA